MIDDIDFSQRLYYDYLKYREPLLTGRRITHKNILPLTERLKDNDNFVVYKAGESSEGRSINIITFGEGDIRVFLWSQMHGDESTATMAIFDIINFLSYNDDFNRCRKSLKRKMKLFFMPMVNPDGAERFQRESVLNIDINRDAFRLQTNEAKVLFDVFNSVKAKFGFNLHDQERTYSAGPTFRSAAISFLAPPYNSRGDMNRTRSDAIKLIVKMNGILSHFIPGHTAKYTDEFEPRAFGDNFQKLGTSTILIESGTWHNDPDKQFVRKLNFIALLAGMKSIAESSYKKEEIKEYYNLPENSKTLFDLLIRNVKCISENGEYIVDLGINRKEMFTDESGKLNYEAKFEDIGDLSVYNGYEDFDFLGLILRPGKIFPTEFDNLEDIRKLDFESLYKNGYLFVKLNNRDYKEKFCDLPFNIILSNSHTPEVKIKSGEHSSFYLEKNGITKYVIINGFIFNISSGTGLIRNGLVLGNL